MTVLRITEISPGYPRDSQRSNLKFTQVHNLSLTGFQSLEQERLVNFHMVLHLQQHLKHQPASKTAVHPKFLIQLYLIISSHLLQGNNICNTKSPHLRAVSPHDEMYSGKYLLWPMTLNLMGLLHLYMQICEQWEKIKSDCKKLINSYGKQYGVQSVTFTNVHLKPLFLPPKRMWSWQRNIASKFTYII